MSKQDEDFSQVEWINEILEDKNMKPLSSDEEVLIGSISETFGEIVVSIEHGFDKISVCVLEELRKCNRKT